MMENRGSEAAWYLENVWSLGIKTTLNKPKMAYSRDALLENSKRQERDKTRVRLERNKRETREIWSYGGWPIIV